MLLQTNAYFVPTEKRAEHARLLQRFRHCLAKLGCDQFECYEQTGANWSSSDSKNRFIQIMRFRDRKHQQQIQQAERTDTAAQGLIKEFCELINFPYQQQQGYFAVGFYSSVLPVAALRAPAAGQSPTENAPQFESTSAETESGEAEAVDATSTVATSAEEMPTDGISGDATTGEALAGDASSGDGLSGDASSSEESTAGKTHDQPDGLELAEGEIVDEDSEVATADFGDPVDLDEVLGLTETPEEKPSRQKPAPGDQPLH